MKENLPILKTLLPMDKLVIWLPSKAPSSILVTLSGMLTWVSSLSANALCPIASTLSGIVTPDNSISRKASNPILKTSLPPIWLGITKSFGHSKMQPVISAPSLKVN
jgi:hypothetical protein